jgi:hypothetical protein
VLPPALAARLAAIAAAEQLTLRARAARRA